MLLEITLIFISLFILSAVIKVYGSVVGKNWWKFMWTGHALIFGIFSLILIIFNLKLNWFFLITISLLFVSGLGMILIMIAYSIENKKLMFKPVSSWITIFISHVFMIIPAIYLSMNISLQLTDLVISWVILSFYFLFMFNKFDIKWILYKPTKIKRNIKLGLMRILIIVFYFSIPAFIYIKTL